jgi:hypothetical protein
MTQRSFIALLMTLVVLGLVVYFAQQDRGPVPTAGIAIVPDLQAALDEVDRLTIAKAGNEPVATLERRADTWVVANKDGYRADVAKIRQSLRALAEAKTVETKTANPELYDRLGVEDVTDANAGGVAVTISAAGTEFGTLILGNAVGTQQRYARRMSEPQSYLVDRNPDFPKVVAQWLDSQIVDVRGERIQQVTITHPDGEKLELTKPSAPPSDLTAGTVVNFAVAGVPAGQELLYPGVANVIGNSLRELNLEDVERAEGAVPERPAEVEFKTFDGLVVKMVGTSRGDEDWVTFEASVDPEQAARFAPTAPEADGAADGAADDAATEPPAGAASAATSDANPAAEAEAINRRVGGWRYKIAGFQYDQMTRRMADLLKPAG